MQKVDNIECLFRDGSKCTLNPGAEPRQLSLEFLGSARCRQFQR